MKIKYYTKHMICIIFNFQTRSSAGDGGMGKPVEKGDAEPGTEAPQDTGIMEAG